MYTLEEFSKQEIQQNVGRQLASIEAAVGHSILFDKKTEKGYISHPYKSPFRFENNASSFYIICKDNIIRFYDFGNRQEWGLTTVSLIAKLLNISKKEAIDYIFNTPAKETIHDLESATELSHTELKVVCKDFISKDCWEYMTAIGVSQLPKEIVEVKYYVIENNESTKLIIPKSLCLAYYFEESGHYKIYSPHEKTHKFITNTDINDMFGFNYMPFFSKRKPLIITKSFKDWAILRNLGYQAIALQSEGCKIPTDKLKEIQKFKKAVLLLDNDSPGINAAKKYQQDYGLAYTYYPLNLGVKDTADLFKKFSNPKIVKNIIDKTLKCQIKSSVETDMSEK